MIMPVTESDGHGHGPGMPIMMMVLFASWWWCSSRPGVSCQWCQWWCYTQASLYTTQDTSSSPSHGTSAKWGVHILHIQYVLTYFAYFLHILHILVQTDILHISQFTYSAYLIMKLHIWHICCIIFSILYCILFTYCFTYILHMLHILHISLFTYSA